MKHKLIALGAFLAVMVVIGGRVQLAQATDPFNDSLQVTFTACNAGDPSCASPDATIQAGESVTTTVHTTLNESPAVNGAFYDSVRTITTGITPAVVPAGQVDGSGSFFIHVAAGSPCSQLSGTINPTYQIYAANDPASPPPYPVLGYAKGLKAPETWANFSANWIADFDDDNNNNIPDFIDSAPGTGVSTLPMTVRDLHGPGGVGGPDGIIDGAQEEPLYLQPLDLITGQTHNFRSIGDAVVAAGVSEVPVDFVTYTNFPAAGENMQLAVISEGAGVGLLPSNPSGSSVSTCVPFDSTITFFNKTAGGSLVQTATASGSYNFQLSTADDFDNDGVPNGLDNCKTVANPTQTDTDGDGIGDACQVGLAQPGDADGDGFPNYADSCPYQKNTVDSDSDGIDNACDPAPSVPGNGSGYPSPGVDIDHDAIQVAAFTLPMASGTIVNGTETLFPDANDNHVADSAETGTLSPTDTLGTGLKPGDADGDGILDGSDPNPLNPGGRIGKCGADCGHDSAFPNVYGDGCDDATEVTLSINGNPMTNTPWAFYDVPAPALFANANPTSASGYRKSGTLSGSGAQAVFGYFKAGANLGTVLYNQDLNKNNVMDGVEYDRKVSGTGQTLGPDGVISASEAQKAFAEFKAGLTCSPTAGYLMNDSTWFNGGNP